jgi:hypothetical protein
MTATVSSHGTLKRTLLILAECHSPGASAPESSSALTCLHRSCIEDFVFLSTTSGGSTAFPYATLVNKHAIQWCLGASAACGGINSVAPTSASPPCAHADTYTLCAPGYFSLKGAATPDFQEPRVLQASAIRGFVSVVKRERKGVGLFTD